jgi:hypothetical protein
MPWMESSVMDYPRELPLAAPTRSARRPDLARKGPLSPEELNRLEGALTKVGKRATALLEQS